MPSYEVIKPCYVPFGNGKLRHRAVGKVVTLDAEEAEKLAGFVRLVGSEEPVRNPYDSENAAETVRNPYDSWTTVDAEVTKDAGEPGSVDEGTSDQTA